MSFAYALLALNLLTTRLVPPGVQLHIRLTAPIGSYASRAGDSIEAVLIAPVIQGGQTILPAGSKLSGTLKSVQRVGFGIVHELAGFDLDFTSIAPPAGESLPLAARVQEVDNARERVTREGGIRGTRPTSTLSYRTGGYIRTALEWEVHAALAVWAIKTLLLQVPESELYYPAGVELTLSLSKPLSTKPLSTKPLSSEPLSSEPLSLEPLSAQAPAGAAPPPPLTAAQRATLDALLTQMPARTYAAYSNRPSDLINVVLIGSRDDVATAFEAAGWAQPQPATMRTNIRRIRAVADGHGYSAAPMSDLLVQDTRADMSWQKSFNDLAKRHHIRIWKQPVTWSGKEVWIGAATHDIDFAFWRPGNAMTHRIAENVDDERDKVVNDLVFTSCASLVEDPERPEVPGVTRNATGDVMRTDGRIAIVQLNACAAPPASLQYANALLPLHGSKLQRFARREILSLRSDVLRENLYWRSYEGVRMAITAFRHRGGRNDDRALPAGDVELKQGGDRAAFLKDMLR